MNGRTPGSVVTLVTPEPPYWSTQSHRCSQNKPTETTIQWQVVHAITCGVQITPTSEITPLRNKPQTQENPVIDWASKNGAKETRTPDPLHAMQVLYQLSYGPITTWKPQGRLSSCVSLHREGLRPAARRQPDGPAPPPVRPGAQSAHKQG